MKLPSKIAKEWFTVLQAQKSLKVSRSTLFRLIGAGKLGKPKKYRQYTVVRKSACAKWDEF